MTTGPEGPDSNTSAVSTSVQTQRMRGESSVQQELRRVLDEIVECACTQVDARYGAVLTTGSDWNLTEFATSGLSRPELRSIGRLVELRKFLGLALKAPKPVRLADVDAHPVAHLGPGVVINNLLAAPLDANDPSSGHLFLANKCGAAEFTEKDERIAVGVAAAAARAIQNARLLQQQHRRQRWLSATAEMTRLLLEDGYDVGAAMHQVTQRVRDISNADYAAIGLAQPSDPDGIVYEVVNGIGLECRSGTRTPRQGIAGSVVSSGEPVIVSDLVRDGRYVPPSGWETALSTLGLTMFMPMRTPDRVLGILIVGWRRDSAAARSAADEDALVQTFADQAALALQRVRAQNERVRHERWLEATADMARLLLREVDRDEAMRLVVRQVLDIPGADFCGIMLADPSNSDTAYVLVLEGPGIGPVPPDTKIPSTGLLARVLATGRRIVSADWPRQEGHLPPPTWAEALSAVGLGTLIPLVAEGQVVGAMFAGWCRGSPHEHAAATQIEHVQILADLAALALQRVRTQDDREQLVVLEERNRIAAEMHDVVVQRLFGAGMRLESAAGMSSESRVRQRVREALADLAETSRHIRSQVLMINDDADDGDCAASSDQPSDDQPSDDQPGDDPPGADQPGG
jgi:GAF domain-containing protein